MNISLYHIMLNFKLESLALSFSHALFFEVYIKIVSINYVNIKLFWEV